MFEFSVSPSEYPYREGSLYVGSSGKQQLGVMTKRHAITIAGSRTGKGVGVIIPNLKLWPHNVLVIDPKGEAATATWKDRQSKGQKVIVLDPFGRADIPDSVRATYNPLDDLDPKSMTIKEDIAAISDGIVLRPNPESEHWDNGAMRLLSGLIAFALTQLPKGKRNLVSVRRILADQKDGGLFEHAIDKMENLDGCGGLMKAGAAAATAKEGGYFVSNAMKHTDWLDSASMPLTLSTSSFSMQDIKRKKVSIFVVLPSKYLPQTQHGRFLRLMVRCGINAMQEPMPDGSDTGEKCLFILDEFFSLGYIDEIAISVGLMAGYGLHLWPFLQDLDQLLKLYGREGAGTFFGSTDIQQFFGSTDAATLDHISQRIGVFGVDDLPDAPELDRQKVASIQADIEADKERWGGGSASARQGMVDAARIELRHAQTVYQDRIARFRNEASQILGKPRLAPEQIAQLVRLSEGGIVAEKQIVFVHGVRPMICDIFPYFQWENYQPNTPPAQITTRRKTPKAVTPKNPLSGVHIRPPKAKPLPVSLNDYLKSHGHKGF